MFDELQFRSGSTRLTREGREAVTRLAALLKAYPSVAVRLEGYTDGRGAESWNKAVSERRAAALKALLEGDGVAASRLTAAGFGEEKPIAPNTTSSGRRMNRRIEVVVTQR